MERISLIWDDVRDNILHRLGNGRCLQQLCRPGRAGITLQQPGGVTRAQPGIGGARLFELQHRGASSAMTGTGHVGMTGHDVALDVGWQLPALGWTKVNVDGSCE
ncbi:hypothetical protein V6N13_023557 [Hibiscus sabdariffa]